MPAWNASVLRVLGIGILGALVAVAASGAAGESEQWGVFLQPRGGQVLQAGQWVEVVWTPLPPQVEEFEILLSLDDGASFTVRLTPQLDPAIRVFHWRVPNLPTRQARLQLRIGIDHREIEGPTGELLEIRGVSHLPAAGARWLGGELWLTPGWAPSALFEPRSMKVNHPQVQPGLELVAAVVPTKDLWQVVDSGWVGEIDLSFPSPTAGTRPLDHRPRDLPLRR